MRINHSSTFCDGLASTAACQFRAFRGRGLLAALALLMAGTASACTYDQADQISKLRELSSSVDDGSLDEARQEFSWKDTAGRHFSVVYGGCDHLGLRISRTEPNRTLPTEPELFAIALELAEIPTWNHEVLILRQALENRSFERVVREDKLSFEVSGTDYAEMVLTADASSDRLVVTVGWVRNF